MKNVLVIFPVYSLITAGCGDWKRNTSAAEKASEKPVGELQLDAFEFLCAEVGLDMTLLEVFKVNSLSETYLKQKSGMPQYFENP